MSQKETKYNAPALDKGLDILEYLSSQSIPLSQTEIAEGIAKSPNEIYRMLMSLENRGYVLRDEISGKYKLTLKLYHLSHRHSAVDELRTVAINPMQELSQLLRESCHLSTLYLDQLMVILYTRSPAPIALSIEEGNLFPLPLTGSGKVLLAYMPHKEEVLQKNKVFKKFTDLEKQEFLISLEQIKQNGYYIRNSHMAEGVVDISVPVGITHNGIVACLTISKLTTMNMEKTVNNENILLELKKCAATITRRIGL